MRRLAGLRRSTGLRLVLWMAGVFTAAMLIAFLVANWLVARDLERQQREGLETEAARLAEGYEAGGAEELERRIARHGGDILYFFSRRGLQDGRGNVLVETVFTGWRTLPGEAVPDGDGGPYLAYGAPVGDGTLILARSAEAVESAKAIFARAMLWGLAGALLLVLAGTLVATRRTERRILAIADTLEAVAAGDMERRAPVAGDDDLGRVALAINGMLDRLLANVASLKMVSADIAHDLRTPLQSLRATLESLRRRPDLGGEAAEVVDDAIDRADRLVGMFQSMLRIAQIEGGSPRARFRVLDLVETVGAVAEAFAPSVEEEGRGFAVDLPDAPLEVAGDRDLLAQMLSNLMTNALLHTTPPAAIAVALRREGDAAVVEVSDRGPGVPEAERELVLRRLYRGERNRSVEGSGLGLSLAVAVAGLHGGSIVLEDNAPGLRAIVRLPLAEK